MALQPSTPPPSDDDPQPVIDDEVVRVSVRRAPKYAVFLVAGALLGVVVALILTFGFAGVDDASPNTGVVYSQMQVFGFVGLICVSLGVLVGGLVALILDRTIGRRTREVTADRERARYVD